MSRRETVLTEPSSDVRPGKKRPVYIAARGDRRKGEGSAVKERELLHAGQMGPVKEVQLRFLVDGELAWKIV